MTIRATIVLLSHRAKLLPGALDSVFAQTEQRFQIIVQHCKENWNTKFNEAASIAKGDYLVPLCDDDLLAPTFLARCLEHAEGDGRSPADMIYTNRYCFSDYPRAWRKPKTWFQSRKPERGVHVEQLGPHFSLAKAGPKGYYTTQFPPDFFQVGATLPMTCCIRRGFWEQQGGYDPEMPHADTEFWARASFVGARFHFVPRALFYYRMHPGQYSHEYASLIPALSAMHRKHFRRWGMLFDLAQPTNDRKDNYIVPVIPEPEREAFMAEVYSE